MSDSIASETLRERLLRALKHKAVLAERSKRLQQQVDDFRSRESSMNHVTSELLQRQRELNYMLHRASSVLHQMQETNLALSAEFTHIVKELPAPRNGEEAAASDWDETINRVNDLFRRTHELAGDMQDDIFRSANGTLLPDMDECVPPAAKESVTSPVTHIEPPNMETCRPEEESRIIEESSVELTPEAEAVEALPSSAEPEIVSAIIVETDAAAGSADDGEYDKSVDELFSRLNAVTTETGEWRNETPTQREEPRKPSLLARIFGASED